MKCDLPKISGRNANDIYVASMSSNKDTFGSPWVKELFQFVSQII